MFEKAQEPFSASEALMFLGIPFPTSSKNARIQCPVCGKKDFYFDLTKNVGHCMRASCGFKCNQISFVAQALGVSNKEAVEAVLSKKGTFKAPEIAFDEPLETATPERRDLFYSSLISNMPLSERHTKDMMGRGLSLKEVRSLGYGTFFLTRENEKEILQVNPEGIPGCFTDQKGQWRIKYHSKGILVPYRNERHEICGIQIRKNEEDRGEHEGKKGSKYTWITSNGKKNGAKIFGCCHFATDFVFDVCTMQYAPVLAEKVLVTEGAMKADIAHLVTKEPILAVPGVKNLAGFKKALFYLKAHGVKVIVDVFDMDYVSNVDVKKAMMNLKAMVTDAGLEYQRRDWTSDHKGYDDYVIANRKSVR